jgi:hypothetical protein
LPWHVSEQFVVVIEKLLSVKILIFSGFPPELSNFLKFFAMSPFGLTVGHSNRFVQ